MSDAAACWWRHPVAVGVTHGVRAVFGATAALPLAAIMATTLGARAGVDATLLDHGGLLLPEVASSLRAARPVLVGVAMGALLFGVVATAAAMAGLLDAMSRPGPRPLCERLGTSLAATPPLLLLWLVTTGVQVLTTWLVVRLGVALLAAMSLDERTTDLTTLGVVLLAALVTTIPGTLHDVVVAALAGLRLRLADALVVGWEALRARPVRLLAAHLARSVTALALLASATLIAMRIGMRASGDALVAQGVLEAALLAATCLRASWLGQALRAASTARSGTALPDDLVSSKKSPPLHDDVGAGPGSSVGRAGD